MDIHAVTSLKTTMPAVLKRLHEHRQPVLLVSHGKAQAVLQDVATYQGTQDALALLKMMIQSEQSVKAGRGSTTKDVLARLRNQVRARDNSTQP